MESIGKKPRSIKLYNYIGQKDCEYKQQKDILNELIIDAKIKIKIEKF